MINSCPALFAALAAAALHSVIQAHTNKHCRDVWFRLDCCVFLFGWTCHLFKMELKEVVDRDKRSIKLKL
jgi:hypothetical protein